MKLTSAVVVAMTIAGSFALCADAKSDYRVDVAFGSQPATNGAGSSSIALSAGAAFPLGNTLHLLAGGGMALSSLHLDAGREGFTDLSFGNPFLGLRYSIDTAYGMSAELRVGIPLATLPGNIPDNKSREYTLNTANNITGWRNPYVWQMNIVPVSATYSAQLPLAEGLSLKTSVEPAFLLSVNRLPSRFALLAYGDVVWSMPSVDIVAGWTYYTQTESLENNNPDQHTAHLGAVVPLSGVGRLGLHSFVCVDAPYGLRADSPKSAWGVRLSYSP